MSDNKIFAVLLAGGIGQRLWPLSQPNRPKQFVPIFDLNESLIQRTWKRVRKCLPAEQILVVGNTAHEALIKEQVTELDPSNLLLEPDGRDTAAAVTWAMLRIQSRHRSAIAVVAPTDHAIQNEDEWCSSVLEIAEVAAADTRIVLLASEHEAPDVRFGLIVKGHALRSIRSNREVFEVSTFVEKPSATVLRSFSGNLCLRSMGTFAASVDAFLEQLSSYNPELYRQMSNHQNTLSSLPAVYRSIESISVDKAVFEQCRQMAVLSTSIKRIDVGDYSAFDQLWPRDDGHNAALGKYYGLDSNNNVVYSPNFEVVTIGLQGYIVAALDNKILICPRERSQEIKAALSKRKE